MKDHIIAIIVLIIAIIAIIIMVFFYLPRELETGAEEPQMGAVELTAEETALLAKIVNKEAITVSAGQTITYETSVRPNEGQALLDMLEKMRVMAKMNQTDYYNMIKELGGNQTAVELDKLIK